MTGRLLLVATPIGNLDDLPPRAVAAFAAADLVACEDTRRTGLLLHNLGIKKPLVSLHEHNERARTPSVLHALGEGKTVAVASDAGTPLLSDPGYVLTRSAIAAGHRVEAIPGASAPLVALLVSGLPPHPFTFAGFPPPKSGKRRGFFRRFAGIGHTLVLFESPHRILASLSDAIAELGDREAALARELTKMNEEVLRGRLSEILANLEARDRVLGELVLVVAGGASGAQESSTEGEGANEVDGSSADADTGEGD
ncbi:MAG: 16S rRNA (cytidine(1402)-2'-O)-methyltransferase [Thermoanaerobaculia bacterium]